MTSTSDSLSVEEAQRIIRERIKPLGGQETLPLEKALSRVVVADIAAPFSLPRHDNAAMDGYAFCAEGLNLAMEQKLAIAGTLLAGEIFEGAVPAGDCLEIMTGAALPKGCDTVVPQEDVRVAGGSITIPAGTAQQGGNVRVKGEEMKAGAILLAGGTLIRPAHLGLLASLGFAEVTVRRRVTVAVFSTGDELQDTGEASAPGRIYDSNRPLIAAMLRRLGCEVVDMGILRDDPEAILAAFLKVHETADVIITSGGVSVGAADFTQAILSGVGEIAFKSVSMRPGRPMMFGSIDQDGRTGWFFGLPGNPVAVMVSFYFFVRDALLGLMGALPAPLPRLRVRSASKLSKRPGRTEFQRGILAPDASGEWVVSTSGPQGSAMLSSMTAANCIIILPEENGPVSPGETVEVILLEGLA